MEGRMLSLLVTVALAAPRPADVGSVDSAGGHVRCHFQRTEDAPRCDQVIVWAEEAWAAQIDGIGFNPPLPDEGRGGTDALDIYLTREAGGAGQAWVDCDAGDPHCVDADPTDGRAGSPSYVVIDPRTSDEEFPHFVHHEFNHTTQYATDFEEPFLSVWEGTAVACERWTDPTWPTIERDFGDYGETPWMSAVLQDGYFLYDYDILSWYEYGAVAWVFFLDDRYGDGHGSVGPRLWNGFAQEAGEPNEPDALDAWDELSGDWRASMLDFAVDRARFGTPAAPDYAAFAPDAYAFREVTADELPATVVPTYPLFPLGTAYVDVPVTAGDVVSIALDGDPGLRWGLIAVEPDADEAVEGVALEHVVTATGVLTVGVVNLGPDGLDADDPLESASFALTISRAEAGDTDDTDSGNGGLPPGIAKGGCSTAAGGSLATILALSLTRRRR
jgi:hypothetical protein